MGATIRLGICGRLQLLTEVTSWPFEYLEVLVQDVLVPEAGPGLFERNRHALRRLPLPVEAANTLLPADLHLIATPDQPVETARVERYIRTAIERAALLGVEIIVLGSGAARACPPGFDIADAGRQIGLHLARWSEWARGSGVHFALEPLRYQESNLINTVNQADMLLRTIAGSGAGLLVDTYHMACNGDPPESLLACTAPVLHVHVAEQRERAAPGRHNEDLRPYFAALQRAGYDGRVSIECIWRDVNAEAGRAARVVREQWRSAAPPA